MDHEIQVSADGRTLWVHSSDGSTVGRFSKVFGMDVHATVTQQMAGAHQCLRCTHSKPSQADWLEFCSLVMQHHGIFVNPNLLTMSDAIDFNAVAERLNVHSPQHRHWSEDIEWRAGRWDPISSAPTRGSTIMHVRGRAADGTILEPMHYACGGGEEQPPFEGWFVPYPSGASGFYQVIPVEWQPLRASIVEIECQAA